VNRITIAVVSRAAVLMAVTSTASAQPPVLVLSDFTDKSGQPLGVKLQARYNAAGAEIREVQSQSSAAVAGKPSLMAPYARVRGMSARVVAIMDTAAAESETFRGLVNQINHTDGMVYVTEGDCASGVRACLPLMMTAMGAHRVLRILVDGREADRDLMAAIGHELQHAVEVLSYRSVKSATAMILLYKRICDVCGRSFETNAAVRAGNAVRDELRESVARAAVATGCP
jgi:hypothetical protein